MKGGEGVVNSNLLREEKRKLLSLMNYEYVELDFSKLTGVLDNNLYEPSWMDIYVLLFKANLPSNAGVYDTLLEVLSKSVCLFYFNDGEKRYIANVGELEIRQYVRYLITKEPIKYFVKVQYIPNKEYIKEILKINKFYKCGVYLKHVKENEFRLENINRSLKNVEEAQKIYDELLDVNDFYKAVKIDKNELQYHYETIAKLGKDKRMLATISNILTFFDCKFIMLDNEITVDKTDILIHDEDTANTLQAKIIDAYHFFRNVINTRDKKDIISEIYNAKVDPNIKKEFEDNVASYINIIKNKDLIDWIITISKESNYTLKITYDEQGVFYIEDSIIVTPLDAKEYYIDYMDSKKEKLAVAIYKNNIISKIKRAWNRFKARFAKI